MCSSNGSQKDIEISCSWEVAGNKYINDAVSLCDSDQIKEKRSLESIVSLDSCINLINENMPTCPLELKLNVTKQFKITEVSIVSEARIIEVYGFCGEYLTTSHAEFIDEWEDMPVYKSDVVMSQPSAECLLKFARFKRKGDMWLYGLHVTVNRSNDTSELDPSVNFQNVNQILRSSTHQITEKADKCKQFLQVYSSYIHKSRAKPPDPQMLLKILESEYCGQHNPFGEKAKKRFSELFSSRVARDDRGSEVGNLQVVTDELKRHIDERLKQLEANLVAKIEDKFNELEVKHNEKLDLILSHLQSVKHEHQ